ncbi:DUF4260 domain-containing protein [Algoriphagus yeomjeoni]|uniref:Uncharacterized protein DUF4260 n=1 Tax=Algoriphagus yeomjeoni TaxID=291403 RepID=A0A327PDU7_9BACT|nr:DUF4260 domain-containing protein [Algoriphagus yeomjeoni]RAI89404.1 uncharacterized protein DUF4260 [Algoriphagus yeomjeoni]
MRYLLKLEEAGLFLLSIYIFTTLNLAWWWFPALLLLPDIGMIGYLFSPKIGAITYNLFHHRLIAVCAGLYGLAFESKYLMLAGIILFAHISFDRLMGYGLKYNDSFDHTHLGMIGKAKNN